MRKETKEIIKLTSKEILLTLFDFSAEVFFKNNSFYYDSVKEYLKKRSIDKINFKNKIYYLKKQGYIRIFIEKKKKYIELTGKGKSKIQKISFDKIRLKRPKRWDGSFRVVIFDIPKKFNTQRDIFRHKLENLGFIRIQKSVYLNPFPCAEEIKEISKRLNISEYVLIMISDIIQTEKQIINEFLDRGLLFRTDLEKVNRKKLSRNKYR